MKRFITLILSLILITFLAGCDLEERAKLPGKGSPPVDPDEAMPYYVLIQQGLTSMVQHPGAKAHDWVRWRVRKGIIPHPGSLPCSACGHTGDYPPHEYHHPNGYDNPSDIVPLCVRCHMKVDGRLRRNGERCNHLNQQARKKTPKQCKICERALYPGESRKGRCKNCDAYLRKYGIDRPFGSSDGRMLKS